MGLWGCPLCSINPLIPGVPREGLSLQRHTQWAQDSICSLSSVKVFQHSWCFLAWVPALPSSRHLVLISNCVLKLGLGKLPLHGAWILWWGKVTELNPGAGMEVVENGPRPGGPRRQCLCSSELGCQDRLQPLLRYRGVVTGFDTQEIP